MVVFFVQWFAWGDAVVIVFSVTDRYSFELVPKYIESVKRARGGVMPPTVITGNWSTYFLFLFSCPSSPLTFFLSVFFVFFPADVVNKRLVKVEEAEEMAYEKGCAYFEVSAKNGTFLFSLFFGCCCSSLFYFCSYFFFFCFRIGQNVQEIFIHLIKELRNKKAEDEVVSAFVDPNVIASPERKKQKNLILFLSIFSPFRTEKEENEQEKGTRSEYRN
jgi:hypothetical protein